MSRATKRYADRRGNRNGGGYGKTAFSILLILGCFGLVGGVLHLGATAPIGPLDKDTGCKTGTVLTDATLVLVDTTDRLSPLELDRARTSIERAAMQVPVGGKLTVVMIDPVQPLSPKVLFSRCSPGRADEVSGLTQGQRKAADKYSQQYWQPLADAIASLKTAADSKTSPILLTITAMTTRPDFDARVRNRRLIVAGDMVEHHNGISHYQPQRDLWSEFVRSGQSSELPANLRGVHVEIEYFRRTATRAVQTDAHRSFWIKWFGERGAIEITWDGERMARAFEMRANQTPRGQ